MRPTLKRSTLFFIACISSTTVLARNEPSIQSLEQAFQEPIVAAVLKQNIQIQFGNSGALKGQTIDEIEAEGHGHAGATDAETTMGCQVALRKALLVIQKRAKKAQGTAVINIQSMHGDKVIKSKPQYYCGIGRAKTEVKLKGIVIRTGTKN